MPTSEQICAHDDFESRSIGAEVIQTCLDCGESAHLWPNPEGAES